MQEDLKFNLVLEEGKDLNQLTIEERGYVNKFTWQQFKEALRDNKKNKIQIEAQIKIDQEAIENIEKHHPYVLELAPEKCHAIALYDSYTKSVKACQDKLREFLSAEIDDEDRKAMILAQIPELEDK
jgi:D-serine dehydratase